MQNEEGPTSKEGCRKTPKIARRSPRAPSNATSTPERSLFLRDTNIEGRRPAHAGDVDEAFRVRPMEFGDVVDGIADIERIVG